MTMMEASPLLRAVLCSMTMLLLFFNILDLVLAHHRHSRTYITIGVIRLLGTYLLHQMLRSVIGLHINVPPNRTAEFCGSVPAACYTVTIVVLLGVEIVLMIWNNHWDQTHLSRGSIKESIDSLPSGIAIYHEDGRCMLVNSRMNQLSIFMTGHAAMDGRELCREMLARERMVEMKGRTFAFRQRKLNYRGEMLHELVADDVSELVSGAKALRAGNEQLAEMARKMRQYGQDIDNTVRKQEILQAKANIHDEMNELLLATRNAAAGEVSEAELKRILRTWQNNALLLCREAETNRRSNMESDLETLARTIGIEICWDGDPDFSDIKCRELFEKITREAMTNAVKHGGAKHLYVNIRRNDDTIMLEYTNDGSAPSEKVRPTGGLKRLADRVEEVGGSLAVSGTPSFALKIEFAAGGEINAI